HSAARGSITATAVTRQRKLFPWELATVCASSRKTEFRRLLKDMNLLSAHRSSNPIWSAMQSVSPMCRDAMRPQGSEPNDGTRERSFFLDGLVFAFGYRGRALLMSIAAPPLCAALEIAQLFIP